MKQSNKLVFPNGFNFFCFAYIINTFPNKDIDFLFYFFSHVLCYTSCFSHLHAFISERVMVSHDGVSRVEDECLSVFT